MFTDNHDLCVYRLYRYISVCNYKCNGLKVCIVVCKLFSSKSHCRSSGVGSFCGCIATEIKVFRYVVKICINRRNVIGYSVFRAVVIDCTVVTYYRYGCVDLVYCLVTVGYNERDRFKVCIVVCKLFSSKSHVGCSGICLTCCCVSAEIKVLRYVVKRCACCCNVTGYGMFCAVIIDCTVITDYRYGCIDLIYCLVTVGYKECNCCKVCVGVCKLFCCKSHVGCSGICLTCCCVSAEIKVLRYVIKRCACCCTVTGYGVFCAVVIDCTVVADYRYGCVNLIYLYGLRTCDRSVVFPRYLIIYRICAGICVGRIFVQIVCAIDRSVFNRRVRRNCDRNGYAVRLPVVVTGITGGRDCHRKRFNNEFDLRGRSSNRDACSVSTCIRIA